MSRDNRWEYPEDSKEFLRIFAAAREGNPQVVFDDDGFFTVSYEKLGKRGSARDFLTKSGREDE
jgi:hypothetical protein